MTGPSWLPQADSSRTLEENWLFRLRKERFRSRSSGKEHDFFVIDLADAVNVIAVTPDRRVVLVRQFRAGSNADSLETPGGLLEDGEDPREAGARELREETGYEGGEPVILGSSWSNPSLLRSRITTILIRDAVLSAATNWDDIEELAVETMPAAEVLGAIRDGRIDHALAVGGLLLWLMEGRMTATGRPIAVIAAS